MADIAGEPGAAGIAVDIITRLDAKGLPGLFREYREWLAWPVPVAPSVSGNLAGGSFVVFDAFDLTSWAPNRLRNRDYQRQFVQTKLA